MPRASPRKRATVNYNEDEKRPIAKLKKAPAKRMIKAEDEVEDEKKPIAKTKKAPAKRKVKEEDEDEDEGDEKAHAVAAPKVVKKRRTTTKKEDDATPLAERTDVPLLKKAMYIGAHVSAAGGVQNSVTNAVQIGANAFALFMKSQRKWANPAMTPEAQNGFISLCKEHSFSAAEHALPHGSYLVNLAQADEDKAKQAYDSFLDDLERCEKLGIRLYNFHPGSTGGDTKAAAIGRIAKQLNKSHKATTSVVTVLENMAGSGNVVGSTWEDLRDIIALVDDKERVGVCIDTCHAFAAGYDMRTPDKFKETVDSFNEIVGSKYLKAFHLNDSKAPLGSNRDLHANIGTGFLGLGAFHSIMNHAAFQGMPMVLETPIDKKGEDGKNIEDKQIWATEIKLLESLIGMDPESSEFELLAEKLQAKGASERSKIQDQVDRKTQKDAKKGSRKPVAKRRKTIKDESDNESD